MLEFDKKYCIGCTACVTMCPKDAIEMIKSQRGFYISHILNDKCVQCGLCETVCPALNETKAKRRMSEIKCYSMYSVNVEERKAATSGGVFFELAKKILAENGVVCGCVWDDNFVAKHVCTEDIHIVEKMRGSKYVQSNLGNCFKEIKKIAETRKVLFSGLPCQVTALKRVVNSGNVLCVSLICGGCPSPEVWRLYKEDLELKRDSELTIVNHRSKSKGWLVSNVYYEFENKSCLHEILMQNIYGANYVKGLTINDACFECTHKLDSIEADLLLGDLWNINKRLLNDSKNMGASIVIPLTSIGKEAIKEIGLLFKSELDNLENVIRVNPPLIEKHAPNIQREIFFDNLYKVNISENLRNNMPKTSHSKIRQLLYKLNIYIPVYTLIWKLRHRK